MNIAVKKNFELFIISNEFIFSLLRAIFFIYSSLKLFELSKGITLVVVAILFEVSCNFIVPIISGYITDYCGPKKAIFYALIFFCLVSSIFLKIVKSIDILPLYTLVFFTIMMKLINPFLKNGVFALIALHYNSKNMESGNGKIISSMQAGQLIGLLTVPLFYKEIAPAQLMLVFIVIFGILSVYNFYIKDIYYFKDKTTKTSEKFFFWMLSKKISVIVVVASVLDVVTVSIFNVLLILVASEKLSNNLEYIAIADAFFAFGGFVSGIYVSRKKKKLSYFSIFISQFSFLLLALSLLLDSFLLSTLLFINFGYSLGKSNIFWKTKIQNESPKNILGRMSTLRGIAITVLVSLFSFIITTYDSVSYDKKIILIVCFSIVFILFYHFFKPYNEKLIRSI